VSNLPLLSNIGTFPALVPVFLVEAVPNAAIFSFSSQVTNL